MISIHLHSKTSSLRNAAGVTIYLSLDALYVGIIAAALCMSFFPKGLTRIGLLTLLFPMFSLALCAWMTVFGFYLRLEDRERRKVLKLYKNDIIYVTYTRLIFYQNWVNIKGFYDLGKKATFSPSDRKGYQWSCLLVRATAKTNRRDQGHIRQIKLQRSFRRKECSEWYSRVAVHQSCVRIRWKQWDKKSIHRRILLPIK